MTEAVIIRTCGDLSAKRPGSGWTRNPVRLPAERQQFGAISEFFSLTRVSRLSAQTAGRREVVTDRIRVRRGPALGGIWKNVRLLNPARNLILGLGRAIQPSEQTARGLTQTLHFLTSIGRSFHETKDRREDRSCRTPFGANPPHLRTSA